MTEKVRAAGCWMSRFKRVARFLRQIRGANREARRLNLLRQAKCLIPCFQEKPLSFSLWSTVP